MIFDIPCQRMHLFSIFPLFICCFIEFFVLFCMKKIESHRKSKLKRSWIELFVGCYTLILIYVTLYKRQTQIITSIKCNMKYKYKITRKKGKWNKMKHLKWITSTFYRLDIIYKKMLTKRNNIQHSFLDDKSERRHYFQK